MIEQRTAHYQYDLDVLRTLACFLVVWQHVTECYYILPDFNISNNSDTSIIGWINSLTPIEVPLFVMISGYFLLPMSTDIVQFFKRVGRLDPGQGLRLDFFQLFLHCFLPSFIFVFPHTGKRLQEPVCKHTVPAAACRSFPSKKARLCVIVFTQGRAYPRYHPDSRRFGRHLWPRNVRHYGTAYFSCSAMRLRCEIESPA